MDFDIWELDYEIKKIELFFKYRLPLSFESHKSQTVLQDLITLSPWVSEQSRILLSTKNYAFDMNHDEPFNRKPWLFWNMRQTKLLAKEIVKNTPKAPL